MSRYAEKRSGQAVCAHQSCTAVGTLLRLRQGRPDWFCAFHADEPPRR